MEVACVLLYCPHLHVCVTCSKRERCGKHTWQQSQHHTGMSCCPLITARFRILLVRTLSHFGLTHGEVTRAPICGFLPHITNASVLSASLGGKSCCYDCAHKFCNPCSFGSYLCHIDWFLWHADPKRLQWSDENWYAQCGMAAAKGRGVWVDYLAGPSCEGSKIHNLGKGE